MSISASKLAKSYLTKDILKQPQQVEENKQVDKSEDLINYIKSLEEKIETLSNNKNTKIKKSINYESNSDSDTAIDQIELYQRYSEMGKRLKNIEKKNKKLTKRFKRIYKKNINSSESDTESDSSIENKKIIKNKKNKKIFVQNNEQQNNKQNEQQKVEQQEDYFGGFSYY